jgi:hypothetical protein
MVYVQMHNSGHTTKDMRLASVEVPHRRSRERF